MRERKHDVGGKVICVNVVKRRGLAAQPTLKLKGKDFQEAVNHTTGRRMGTSLSYLRSSKR